jgi:hypothetical protein
LHGSHVQTAEPPRATVAIFYGIDLYGISPKGERPGRMVDHAVDNANATISTRPLDSCALQFNFCSAVAIPQPSFGRFLPRLGPLGNEVNKGMIVANPRIHAALVEAALTLQAERDD